ncbi:hypothetical protein LCGC14_2775590, partial [marine sediment metagenome]
FKNPVFLHQWRVLSDLIRNPYFIVVKRNLESNAKSFSEQTDYSYEDILEIFTQLGQNQYIEVINQNISNLRNKMN